MESSQIEVIYLVVVSFSIGSHSQFVGVGQVIKLI